MKRTTSKKTEELENAAVTRQPETPLEALYRRVKQAQQRRKQKLKHVNP